MTAPTLDTSISIVRRFKAPRPLVYEAWTDVNHVTNWWGPHGFSVTTSEHDFRPGGVWRFTMHAPDGTDFLNRITFREIVRPEKLVYDHAGEGATADIWFTATILFTECGDETEVTLQTDFDTVEARDRAIHEFGAVEGGNQTLARFGDHLATVLKEKSMNKLVVTTPSDLEIQMVRDFDAPRDLVFATMTQAEHIREWFGCGMTEMVTCDFDFRVGGSYRFVVRDRESKEEFPFKGEVRAIDAPTSFVHTQIYDVEPFNQFEAVITIVLEDLGDGRTRMVETIKHATKEARDGHLQSGMEYGASLSLDRLEEIAKSLAK